MAVSYGCSLGRQKGFAGGSVAGKDEVVHNLIKRDAQVVVSKNERDESPHPADDRGSAGTPTEDDDGWIVDSDVRGWQMDSQRATISAY